MTLQEFKHELRMDLSLDHWAYAMGALVEVCEHLHHRDADIPGQWQFRPSPIQSEPEQEGTCFYEMFTEASEEQLLAVGWLLHRYTDFLRFKKLDY